jgi:hypothetical protein
MGHDEVIKSILIPNRVFCCISGHCFRCRNSWTIVDAIDESTSVQGYLGGKGIRRYVLYSTVHGQGLVILSRILTPWVFRGRFYYSRHYM